MSGTWTYHGGRLDLARQAYGEPGEPWLDLSTGINPHAWPADTVRIDWRRLPEESAVAALEHAAAAYFGSDPAHVAALPGTEIGLRLLGNLLPGPARHAWPSYRTHGEMFADSSPLSGGPADEGGVTILANPNNPDGGIIGKDRLRDRLARAAAATGWLVVDEAFADTDPTASMAAHVGDGVPLVVFRSFGKFFGLAGLRLGFVVAPRTLIAAFRARLGAWPVSAAALAIGTAAYRDEGWIGTMRGQLAKEAARLDAVLRAQGYDPHGACPLFRLIETDHAAALFERLARSAILTRPFDYDRRWLRLGLPGSDAGLARLARALSDG